MKYLILILLSFISFNVLSQTLYGNEWIKKDQKYVKIKLSENGIYRVTYSQLQATGILNNNPNPKNIQLFFRGQEIPIYIEGENDQSFDPTDFIEFYGKKNDGKLDEVLYSPSNLQPNPEVSLFNDESAYFLTISPLPGKRYQTLNINNAGLIPENYMVYTTSENFAETYYPGAYLVDIMSLSEYIDGEGYLGNTLSIGTSQNRNLNTPSLSNSTGFMPFLDFYVAGRSNSNNTNPSGFNHHLKVNIGSTSVKDTLFSAYSIIRSKVILNPNLISNTTTITFSSVNDLGAITDFQAPAYARITYPRSFEASGYSFLPFKLNSSNTQCLLSFLNTNWNNSYILDTENGYRYLGNKIGTTTNFNINNPVNNQLIVYDQSVLKTPTLEAVNINLVDATTINANLLIITNDKLIESANEYATYKTSRGFKPLVITTDELYNQFYYGLHHPLAIKNFAKYLLSKGTVKPEYLLLLGKGYETPKNNLANDLVPTMGFPCSDTFLSSEIVDNNLAQGLATGRIPAKTNDDVRIYLNKLKLYDQQPDSIWRKNIINIAGGANSTEDASFSAYLNSFSNIAAKENFGAKTISYYKSVTDPITDNLVEKISNYINTGSNLLTYLGHGSSTNTAVSIGSPAYLNNKNKLLFYLINGCSTGNAFTTGSLGESYIFQPEKGAIGWLGTSSEGIASYLSNFVSLFYQNAFNANYGNSVAKNMLQAARSYQNPNDALNKVHLRQFTFLGDPTISFYSPTKPDYDIKNQGIGFTTTNVTAKDLTLQLFAIVKNNGKAVSNNIPVSIKRTLADNTIINYPIQSYQKVLNTDTLIINIDNNIANAAGNNKFTLTIDPGNTIDELNKLNNVAEFTYFLPSNGITVISPAKYAIVGNTDVNLKVESNNLFAQNIDYVFEIDTISTFNSSWKKTSPVINSGLFAVWKPNIAFENNKVYYWRAKINDNTTINVTWQNSSFTYLNNSPDGWNQGHYQQFTDITLKNISINNTNHQFSFTTAPFPVLLRTRGVDAPTNTERRIRVSASNGSIAFNTMEFMGVSLAAFNPINSSNLFNYPSVYNFKNDGVNGSGEFYFNTNNAVEVDSLVRYINNIPQGYYVVGISGVDFSPKDLPENAKIALQSIGLTMFENVLNGEPYAFWGKKGSASGSALEKTADYSSTIPPKQQIIDFSHDYSNLRDNGYYLSEKIGPSTKWNLANFNLDSNQNDVLNYSIIGLNSAGTETILKTNITSPEIDLSDINSNTYRYIKIKAQANDNIDFSAANLKSWKVLYNTYPDITFNPEFANTFYNKIIQEGDSLKLSIGISNLEKITSDSVLVSYKITKNDRSTISGVILTTVPLNFADNQKINFSYPTLGLAGANSLQLFVSPKNQKDKHDFNNQVNYNFTVNKDNKEPLINVLFDNKRIINGEIVSPEPKIQISVTDENKYLLLKDTTGTEVYLKKKDDTDFKRIAFNSNKISLQSVGTTDINKINFVYAPDVLSDGNYILKIRSKDASGNYNTSNDYSIEFEVINQESITNFLPYPNPFTTSMRFVFQVTGKVPDKIKVQIMTVTGKIVREVFKDELGPIQIGNNISTFAWDGTDQFGDRLANGIYFYRVITENNNKSEIKYRANNTDNLFKKNFGKIYLMR